MIPFSCLFRQAKPDEARTLFSSTRANVPPLPVTEPKPVANDATRHDPILWLACKEAKALPSGVEAGQP